MSGQDFLAASATAGMSEPVLEERTPASALDQPRATSGRKCVRSCSFCRVQLLTGDVQVQVSGLASPRPKVGS